MSTSGADGTSSNKTRKQQILDPEGLAIASFIIQSKKNRREIEEAGFNKGVNNDKGLPDWFVKDQKQHWTNRAPVQITKVLETDFEKLKRKKSLVGDDRLRTVLRKKIKMWN